MWNLILRPTDPGPLVPDCYFGNQFRLRFRLKDRSICSNCIKSNQLCKQPKPIFVEMMILELSRTVLDKIKANTFIMSISPSTPFSLNWSLPTTLFYFHETDEFEGTWYFIPNYRSPRISSVVSQKDHKLGGWLRTVRNMAITKRYSRNWAVSASRCIQT